MQCYLVDFGPSEALNCCRGGACDNSLPVPTLVLPYIAGALLNACMVLTALFVRLAAARQCYLVDFGPREALHCCSLILLRPALTAQIDAIGSLIFHDELSVERLHGSDSPY